MKSVVRNIRHYLLETNTRQTNGSETLNLNNKLSKERSDLIFTLILHILRLCIEFENTPIICN